MSTNLYDRIRDIPLYDTHMHASSLASVGAPRPDGFETDCTPGCPAGETTLFTLLDAPYFGGKLLASGLLPRERPADFAARWAAYQPALLAAQGTGFFAALDTALSDLYGLSLTQAMEDGAQAARALSGQITARYRQGLFPWSAEAMRRAHITAALKPVHSGYIRTVADGRAGPGYEAERALYTPILRTDDFFGTVDTGGRLGFAQLEDALGAPVDSLDALDAAIDTLYACVLRIGSPCVKQAQAYRRTLRFGNPSREEASAAFAPARAGDAAAALTVQDYVMEQVLARGMKYQIHTGVINLDDTSPVLLRGAIERHPHVPFVLLHGHPYFSQSASLACGYANVYLDCSWLQLLSPALLRTALREYLGLVPMNKIFLSTDATSPEEQYGAAVGMRRSLAAVLQEKVDAEGWDEALALRCAHALLHGNAERFYCGAGA